ncbi:MAG: YbaB/EbfC family nucleoid-associated protein [Capsulimonadaceae bacterium]|nr:YbaB/EbfC family nucleoid-associated protein [Capsulimonadaceae bacterium]
MQGGFGNKPGNMLGMVKAMQQAVKQAEVTEAELAKERIEAVSGGGVVRAAVNGKGELIEIKIAKEVVDPNDVVMLEDLVATAVREAIDKANAIRTERLQKLIPAGGLNLPPGLF